MGELSVYGFEGLCRCDLDSSRSRGYTCRSPEAEDSQMVRVDGTVVSSISDYSLVDCVCVSCLRRRMIYGVFDQDG